MISVPGSIVCPEGVEFMRGHGTYVSEDQLVASVAGVVNKVNKLVSVQSLKSRYFGDVGDVVVARVVEVGSKRWRLDVNGRCECILMLSSVNLPGGIQRRRTYEDQLQMRTLFSEGDILTAEVHSYFGDGSMALHTRSDRYGKLNGGTIVKVPCSLVPRLKKHFVEMHEGQCVVVFGCNGYVWVGPGHMVSGATQDSSTQASVDSDDVLRKCAEISQSIRALGEAFIEVSPKTVAPALSFLRSTFPQRPGQWTTCRAIEMLTG